MSRSRKNPLDAFDALVSQREHGKAQPAILPTHLLVRKIKVRPEVFQHRSPAQYVSDAHIRDLADKAKRKDLDPVTVWWDGKHWTVIDGHHRMQGYMRANRAERPVPVEVFEGTPEQALARAAGSNAKAKLQMSTAEKATAAWRLVVMGSGMSKAQQAESADVSERLVAMMRSAKATLINTRKMSPESLSEMKWQQARREAAGNPSEWTPEEEADRVEKMAKALHKALGSTADRQPDIFWQALEIYSPNLARALRESYLTPEDEPR